MEIKFVCNESSVDLVREDELEGNTYLVFPVIPIKEGVLNEEFVSASEIEKFYESWNGRPITVNHPTDSEGNFLSANSPEVLEQFQIGQLFFTKFEDKKLKGEVWIQREMAEAKVGGETVVNRVLDGEMLQVSTGYWRDFENKQGVYNGKTYNRVASNIKPDHLAILLDDVGACSVEDGCGAPRVNAEESEGINLTAEVEVKEFAVLQKSIDTLINLVKGLFSNREGEENIEDESQEVQVNDQAEEEPEAEVATNEEGCGCTAQEEEITVQEETMAHQYLSISAYGDITFTEEELQNMSEGAVEKVIALVTAANELSDVVANSRHEALDSAVGLFENKDKAAEVLVTVNAQRQEERNKLATKVKEQLGEEFDTDVLSVNAMQTMVEKFEAVSDFSANSDVPESNGSEDGGEPVREVSMSVL